MSDHHEHSKEIWVNYFTEKSAAKFREQVQKAAEGDPNKVIPIYIDSYGGYVDSLAHMIETMDEMPNRFITICSGKAMSCGAILFSHGDMRYVGKMSRIMIHNVSSASWGDVFALKSGSEESMRLNKVFMGLLAKNCNMTYAELQQKIKDATDSKEIWLSASDAKKFGIADEVGTPILTPITLWQVENAPHKERIEQDKPKKKTTRKKTTTKKKTTKKTATKSKKTS